jgi:peptidoglycan/LPS O-acetylase OafA/YrhL
MVVLAHLFKIAESLGLWGVELFFALSGFLIGKILIEYFINTNNFDLKILLNFWKRRWYRTVPNYLLFLIITIIIGYIGYQKIPELNIILKSIFFIQNFTSRLESFYGISWSLCIEEWFYLIYPIPLLFIRTKDKRKSLMIYTLVFILFGIILRYFFSKLGVGHSLRGITIARLDAIAYGTLIAILVDSKTYAIKHIELVFYLGICILTACIYYVYFSENTYEEIRSNPFILSLIPFSFACIIPQTTELSILPGYGLITKISKWSYSMYLSHLPIIFIVYIIMEDMRSNNVENLFSKIIAFGICIFFSRLVYKYFEKPFTLKRPKKLS